MRRAFAPARLLPALLRAQASWAIQANLQMPDSSGIGYMETRKDPSTRLLWSQAMTNDQLSANSAYCLGSYLLPVACSSVSGLRLSRSSTAQTFPAISRDTNILVSRTGFRSQA